jgi:hypothetical protein
MAVMPTCVAVARVFGLIGQPALIGDCQTVHVRAQHQSLARAAGVQQSYNASESKPSLNTKPQFFQIFRNNATCAYLFKARLRVLMEILINLKEFFL